MPLPTDLLATISASFETGAPDATIAAWRRLRDKLDPLLGSLSSSLLFVRSLEAHQAQFPWLKEAVSSCSPAFETVYDEFARRLDQIAPEELARVNRALLATYTEALCDLIGVQLSTRFLRSAFPDASATKNT